MREKNLALMDDVISGIEQSDEWDTIQKTDPMIRAANERLEAALDTLEGSIPAKQREELFDAAFGCTSAYSSAGILYGMHVAFAIMDAVGNVPAMSQHVLERMGSMEVSA